jgi:hypothetical protein
LFWWPACGPACKRPGRGRLLRHPAGPDPDRHVAAGGQHHLHRGPVPGQVSPAGRAPAGQRLGTLPFKALFILSLAGGALGGLLLLNTPSSVFARLVPWLVLFATAVFAWGSFFRKPARTRPTWDRSAPASRSF